MLFYFVLFYFVYFIIILFDKRVILGASFTMYDEAFPLFAMSQVNAGGLGATTTGLFSSSILSYPSLFLSPLLLSSI
jgi:hypothetical protein